MQTVSRIGAPLRTAAGTVASLALLALLGALAACDDSSSAAQQQAALPPPPAVSVAKPVVRQVVEDDEFVGRFEAVDEVDIRARVGGYLQQVHFTDGAIVAKGDLLFTIDQRPFKTAVAQRSEEHTSELQSLMRIS